MSRQLRQADVSASGKTSSHAGKGLKSMTRPSSKKAKGRLRLTSRVTTTPLLDDSNEENNSDAAATAEEDDNTTDANDEDEIAPSGRSNHRRGHQTGLSVSLSNATINHPVRKRTWSNRVREDDEMKRPEKLTKAQSETSEDNEDSDAGYDGVDLISESEDDDPEREEEKMIIQSEEDNDDDEDDEDDEEENDTARPSSSSSSESWGGFEDNGNTEESTFFTEHFERTNSMEESSAKSTRRVRFVDEIAVAASSSAESTDSEDDFFPDLFLQQDQLDPRFRAILEKESDSEGSYWDLGFGDNAIDDQSEEDDGESSGYESDDGETTDEEILPPPTIRPQSSQNSDAKSPSRTPQRSIRRSLTTPGSSVRRQGPSLASWTVDPAKPYAIVDKTGNKLNFFPAQRPSSRPQTANGSNNNSASTSPTRASSSRATYETDLNQNGDFNQEMLLKSPANLMMSGFVGNGANIEKLFGSQVVGPPEAFFPFRNIDANGQVNLDDDDENDDEYDDDDEDDPEDNLDMNDFIDFGDSSDSDGEGGEEDVEEENGSIDPSRGLIIPNNAAAFRRNQLRVQGHHRQPRAFKTGTAVKIGRLDSADQPISPIRKQRNGSYTIAATRRIGTVSSKLKAVLNG